MSSSPHILTGIADPPVNAGRVVIRPGSADDSANVVFGLEQSRYELLLIGAHGNGLSFETDVSAVFGRQHVRCG